MTAVDATLQVEQPDASLDPLKVAADVGSPTGVALPTIDAGLRAALAALLLAVDGLEANTTGLGTEATLQAVLTELQQKLEAFPSDFPDVAVLAKAEAIRALLAGTLTVAGAVAVSNFPATTEIANDVGNPVPVSGTVTTVDHRERTLLDAQATVTSSGSTTIVTPAEGKFLRLWWVYAINDPTASTAPIIKVFTGADERYRAYAISKTQRIDGAVDAPLIVDLSASGVVAVSVLYEEVTP